MFDAVKAAATKVSYAATKVLAVDVAFDRDGCIGR